MDIASLLGLIGALGFIIYAMVSGGGVGPFIDCLLYTSDAADDP